MKLQMNKFIYIMGVFSLTSACLLKGTNYEISLISLLKIFRCKEFEYLSGIQNLYVYLEQNIFFCGPLFSEAPISHMYRLMELNIHQ